MTTKEKLQSIQKIIRKLIKKPTSIFLILKDENEYRDYLQKKYGRINFPTVDINYFLETKNIEISNYAFLEGGSLLTDLALLKSITSKFEKCDYLEIGTWRGESIVNVADVAGASCTSVNLSPEQIIALGFPEKYAYEHACLIKDRKNIELVHADSQIFDFSSLKKRFDLIFVDGDHKYEAVKSDTRNVFQLLKNDNSIIVWHDYGFDPVTPRYSVISGILDGLPEEEHKHLYHVSNTMCAVYIKSDEPEAFNLDENHKLNKIFRINMENYPFQP